MLSKFKSPNLIVRAALASMLFVLLVTPLAIAGGENQQHLSHSRLRQAVQRQVLQQSYPKKLMRPLKRQPKMYSADQAAKVIKPGDHVFFPIGQTVAGSIVDALMRRSKDPQGGLTPQKPVQISFMSNTITRKLFDRQGKIQVQSWFLGPNSRDAVAAGRGAFIPTHFSRAPRLIREGKIKVDKAVVAVSPPDDNGFVTLGTTNDTTVAALGKAKYLIAEVNPNVPVTFGNKVHISRFNCVVKCDEPLRTVPDNEPNEKSKAIAQNIVGLVPKNPTIQFGIGEVPNAVAGLLANQGRKDIRVHSEMISDGVKKLVEAGAVKGKVRYSFAWGSQNLLNFMNGNKKFVSYPVDFTNNQKVLSRIPRLISINSGIEVDLLGQVNAQKVRNEWYSGVGGQQDFFRGAMASKGGKAIMAVTSTALIPDGKGGKKEVSRIVPRLAENKVTTGAEDIMYVVTEYGIAHLDGKSEVQRARELIKVAAPKFRAELTQALNQQLAARKQAEQQRYNAFINSKRH